MQNKSINKNLSRDKYQEPQSTQYDSLNIAINCSNLHQNRKPDLNIKRLK